MSKNLVCVYNCMYSDCGQYSTRYNHYISANTYMYNNTYVVTCVIYLNTVSIYVCMCIYRLCNIVIMYILTMWLCEGNNYIASVHSKQ